MFEPQLLLFITLIHGPVMSGYILPNSPPEERMWVAAREESYSRCREGELIKDIQAWHLRRNRSEFCAPTFNIVTGMDKAQLKEYKRCIRVMEKLDAKEPPATPVKIDARKLVEVRCREDGKSAFYTLYQKGKHD